MNFENALGLLKAGNKISRQGWNGRSMWLVLVPGQNNVEIREGTPYARALGAGQVIEILPHIDMWTVNSEGRRAMLPGWLASQSDLLADDWEVVA